MYFWQQLNAAEVNWEICIHTLQLKYLLLGCLHRFIDSKNASTKELLSYDQPLFFNSNTKSRTSPSEKDLLFGLHMTKKVNH
jgi:hypothetical protein